MAKRTKQRQTTFIGQEVRFLVIQPFKASKTVRRSVLLSPSARCTVRAYLPDGEICGRSKQYYFLKDTPLLLTTDLSLAESLARVLCATWRLKRLY